MGLHPYCIVPPGRVPRASGIAGRPVGAVAVSGLAVWCTDHETPPEPSPVHLQEHDRVVRAAFSDEVTPLPLRFGQWYPDEAALAQRVAERREEWVRTLERLAGAVEMGVRIARSTAAPAAAPVPPAPGEGAGVPVVAGAGGGREPAGSGRAYLEQLRAAFRAEQARAEAGTELLGEVAGAVGALAAAVRAEPVPEGAAELRVAHLVRWAELHAYAQALSDLRRRRPDLRIAVTGPWPPYTFVE